MLPAEEHQELLYQIALSYVPGIGAKNGRALLEHFGDAVSVFRSSIKEVNKISKLGDVRIKGFRDDEIIKRAERELAFLLKNEVGAIYHNHGYPMRLTNCVDAPLVLFYKGNADLDAAKIVAIVGTRKNTDYGTQLCQELVEGLRTLDNVLIVSGLALGIDAVAHKRAVALGLPTVGVLGHGIDRIYPYTHKELAAQMMERGGVLTEFASGTLPDRPNFPMRNRMLTLTMYVCLLGLLFSLQTFFDF